MPKLIEHARLLSRLHYEPKAGLWTWLASFNNGVRAGDEAGDIKPNGYRYIGVDGQRYQSSRLAWFYMTGEWPEVEVEHKDVNPANDKWKNLRLATRSQNAANMKFRGGSNKFKGITRSPTPGKWVAQITVNYKHMYLGTFRSRKEAHAAYCAAAKEHFGEFSRAS